MNKPSANAKKQERYLQLMQHISQLVASNNSTENIMRASLDTLLKQTGFLAAQIYQLSSSGNDIWLYLEYGQRGKGVTQIADIFPADEINIISDTVRQDQTIYLANVAKGPYVNTAAGALPYNSELAIPLKFGAEKLGVLRLQCKKIDAFAGEDISYLTSVANLLASALRNNRRIEQLNDSIQEIKTLYQLQHQQKLQERQRSVDHERALGYEYNQTAVAKSNAAPPAAPPNAGVAARQYDGSKGLIAPIKLHNQVIGVLGLEDAVDAATDWTDDDIRLLEEVSSQVALAIENARLLQQTKEQTNELSILFEATRQLTETIQLDHIYEILTAQIINYLNADRCSVLLLNPTRTHFEQKLAKLRKTPALLANLPETRTLVIEDSLVLQNILKQPERFIKHTSHSPADPHERAGVAAQQPAPQAQTITLFPIIVRSKLIGLLEVEHYLQRHDYTQNELQLAQAIISQVTVAIENAQLFEQTDAALKDTQKLYDISRKLVESASINDVYEIILATVRSYDVDRVSISLLDRTYPDHSDTVTIAASWDRDPDKWVPVGTQFSGTTFSLVETFAKPPFNPLISHDLRKAEGQDKRMDDAFRRYTVDTLGAVTMFSAPMFLGNEYKGVISIYTRKPHTYTTHEVRIYQTLADQAIIAIENYRLLETTRRERDRAALLYELGQALSQTTSVGEVQNVVLNFIEKLGGTDGELFITDGDEFVSLASTVLDRQQMPRPQLEALATGASHEAYAIDNQEILVVSSDETPKDGWMLNGIDCLSHVHSLVCVPFVSQRSTLQGVLSLYRNSAERFSDDHVAMLESVAIQTATSLENAWLLRQTNVVLHETELLYNVTRGFNAAQTVTNLLHVMAQNLIDPVVDYMAVGFIPGLDTNNTPRQLNIQANWQRHSGEVTASNLVLHPTNFEFLRHINATTPKEIFYSQLGPTTRASIDAELNQLRTILAVPLSVGGNWLGTLLLGSQAENYTFKVNTISQTATLASQAAIVIQNLKLVDETQQNLYYAEVLSNLGKQLLTAANAESIYDLTLSAIAATKPDRGGAIFMYDQREMGVEVELTAMWDHPGHQSPAVPVGSRFSAEELGVLSLLKTGRTVVTDNAATDQRFTPALQQLLAEIQITAMVAVPIWLNKEVSGFVLIGNKTATPFAADMIRLYEDIGREASGALENRRLYDEARYRAWQLQTAAEISQAATAYLDLNTLLSESVELIRERFSFYHVSIFLLDDYQRYAEVKASTGEIWQKMLQMGHKLEVGGTSIVGDATSTGKSQIALEVGADATHFNNPLLPDTRSETALPLIAQGRVIGALDVHSTRRRAFSQTDISILQSMANQLANAIEAARAYQESRQALEEVQKLHNHYLIEQWESYIKEKETITGFQLAEDGQIIELGVPPRQPKNGDRSAKPERLVTPLTLHGQAVIGALEFDLPQHAGDDAWADELRIIVEEVSNQAAQAIESARLFEQTRISRREAEALYEVGRILVTTEDETEMFNAVLDKMLPMMGLKQGGVLVINEDGVMGRLHALFIDGRPVENPNIEIPIAGNLSYDKLISTKQPVAIDDFKTDPLVEKVREFGVSTNLASLLLVPIVINDQVVGALGADAVGQQHHFTEREMNLAKAMADQLAITLQNRRLIRETQRRAMLLQTSSDVSRVATSILDEDVMMDQTVELIREGFGFEHAEIYLVDKSGRNAVLHKSEVLGIDSKIPVGGQTIVGLATRQRRAVMGQRASDETAHLLDMADENLPQFESQLGVPLHVGGTLIGALSVLSNSPAGFTDEEVSTLETLAAQLSVAIQNARAFREQQETAERLKEIDKLKTQFLANMSHELRTPLNSIIGFSRVILKGIDGPLTEMQKSDLTAIHNSGQHLLGLINNILDLSKIEAGKMELNFEEIEVEPIVKTVMSTAIALVKDKPVTLHSEVPDNLPKILADPTRIRQIILNLVSNACKFTDEGMVTTRVFAEPDRVVFTVTDTGIGIPEEKLDHIFEEFTQVDASTTRKAGGSGLGLPISRHFVEMHHGEIWVESALGVGTTFGFFVPTSPTGPADAPPPLTERDLHLQNNNQRVVVAIDDDPGVIDLYRRFLEQRSYNVIGLSSSKNAVEKIKELAPYAILLDVIIPEKDGWSVMQELKSDPQTKAVPIIICSIVSDKHRGFSLGAANYLTKPIVESDLIDALKLLDIHQKEVIKVLIVDDKADDVLLVRRMLEAQPNFQIFEAGNGKEGLDLVESDTPDLIILDLNMPEMDGFAMIEALKQNEASRHIPIVIVSAEELSSSQQDYLTGQVEVLLRKGLFSENELLEDVGQALEKLGRKVQSPL